VLRGLPPASMTPVFLRLGLAIGRMCCFRAFVRFSGIVLLVLFACAPAQANPLVFCSQKVSLTPEQQDKLLLFSGKVKELLAKSGHRAAIISRSGIDLDKFGIRYSHSGFTLRDSKSTPWSVRQLYYGCEESRPSIYDQGLAGFLMDHENAINQYVSIVFVPDSMETDLEQAALNDKVTLKLLGAEYSANAYPFSIAFQNCNQWVLEVMAYAWGKLGDQENSRQAAQSWLKARHYQPTSIDVKYAYMVWGTYFLPLVHSSDHPSENVQRKIYQVSMPASVEHFVQTQAPKASRVELCLNGDKMVVHHGWDLMKDRCQAGPGDEVMSLL